MSTGLELHQVSRSFAGVQAVRHVDLCVRPGRVTVLVGPNGSGKTTLANLASGALRPDTGRVLVDGADLTGAGSRRFASAGVVRTFQGLRLFDGLTVFDNVLVGAQRGERLRLSDAWLRMPASRARERARRDCAYAALALVDLTHLADRSVAMLSHGQRRRVELARAFAARPRYLVLDEPAAGLDPAQADALVAAVTSRRDQGVGCLLVEHDTDLVSAMCDEVATVVDGSLVTEDNAVDGSTGDDVVSWSWTP